MRTVVLLPLLLASTHAYAADENLFNGKDLTGWVGVSELVPPAPNRRTTAESWSVKDGAIACSGKGGHLYTVKTYTNFRLRLEYRWGQIDPEVLKRGGNIYNAGIFMRASPRPSSTGGIQLIAYQAQIVHTPARTAAMPGGTGDMWISGYDHPTFKGVGPLAAPLSIQIAAAAAQGATPAQGAVPAQGAMPAPLDLTLPPGLARSRNYPALKFADKAIGEWNSYDITVNGDKLTYRVNGQLVNEGSGAPVFAGRIGLECEGTPIAYRNIRVTPL